MQLQFDPESLTLGDLEDFESYVGLPLERALDPVTNQPSTMRALVGLLWILHRQQDPQFTLQQARALKLHELEFSVDPTPATPPRGGRRRAAAS